MNSDFEERVGSGQVGEGDVRSREMTHQRRGCRVSLGRVHLRRHEKAAGELSGITEEPAA